MTEPLSDVRPGQPQGGLIRLRTLVQLRWITIFGQIGAMTVVWVIYGVRFDLPLAALAVGLAVLLNIAIMLENPDSRRVSDHENMLMVCFDLGQLSFLLFVTGGLHNPFAFLILGPVTVSATVLSLRSTVIVWITAVVLLTCLTGLYMPLRLHDGTEVHQPDILIFGTWTAIVIALTFLSLYSRQLATEMTAMSNALTATKMALAREQKLTDLGGVVAAAAHELGTPLATITLTSAELIEDLAGQPDLQEDAALIRSEADRCRDILREMGTAGKSDLLVRHAPFSEVLREAAAPHQERGIDVTLTISSPTDPIVERRPEIIHGLRNLVQNAVDHARAHVNIELGAEGDTISVTIRDDGPGFALSVLTRIGEPFIHSARRRRKSAPSSSEGMGLGLFIAKTLLERGGATLEFRNAEAPKGAVVTVRWAKEALKPEAENAQIGADNPYIYQ